MLYKKINQSATIKTIAISLLMINFLISGQAQTTLVAQKKMTAQEYIEKFKEIAIREMERKQIPASITLAQGLHESSNGNSRLATEANNHFGIKCHKNWTGETFYMWDDDPTESCFRKYDNAETSYVDHSEFLLKDRYKELFSFDITDYESWAHGLKKAGYATDSAYAKKLIANIQRHKLYEYDLAMSMVDIDNFEMNNEENGSEIYVTPQNLNRQLRRKTRSNIFKEYQKGLFQQNGITYAVARENETALEFAARFDIPYRKFLIFNDLVDGDKLVSYQYCFIQPKKQKYKGTESFHKIEANETMYEIAQYYGLKLSDLLERNLLKEGQEPKVGEVVLLNDKAATAPKTRSNYEIERDIQFEESTPNQKITEEKKQEQKINTDKVNNSLKLDVPVYSNETYNPAKQVNSSTENDEKFENISFPAEDKSDFSLEPESEINNNESKVNTAPALSEKEYVIHNVENGETLFSIGRKYGVSWDKIRDYNQLDKISLETNQEIKIPRL